MPPELVGREGELSAIHGFLEQLETGLAALTFSGDSGIGKTVLWEAGVEQARGLCADVTRAGERRAPTAPTG
jgi:predicted ATPase